MKRLLLAGIFGLALLRSGDLLPLRASELNTPQARRPQEPQRPFPYQEQEVQFENPAAKATLRGTLTLPKGTGPLPAVLLVAGSGPKTRDGLAYTHRSALVLSDCLTRRGLAVLRYDKRGAGKSTGDFDQATTQDFADDAVAGMEFLKNRTDIDPKRIGAIGHSEGGWIVPMLAANWPATAFIVMLAAPAMAGEEMIVGISHLALQEMGATDDEKAQQDAITRRWFDLVKRGADAAEMARQLRPMVEAAWRRADTNMVEKQMAAFNSPWLRWFVTNSCVPALQKVQCPVLALHGDKDVHIPAKESLRAIARAMTVSCNTDFVIREMPGLNHLFQHCKTGSRDEYPGIEETMSPEVLQIVGDWILQHVQPARCMH